MSKLIDIIEKWAWEHIMNEISDHWPIKALSRVQTQRKQSWSAIFLLAENSFQWNEIVHSLRRSTKTQIIRLNRLNHYSSELELMSDFSALSIHSRALNWWEKFDVWREIARVAEIHSSLYQHSRRLSRFSTSTSHIAPKFSLAIDERTEKSRSWMGLLMKARIRYEYRWI